MVMEMNERAQEIFGQAFDAVERLENLKVREQQAGEPDVLQRWESLRPQEKPRRERQTRKQEPMPQPFDWDGWCNARIAAALEEQQKFHNSLLAEVIAILRKERENDVAQMKERFEKQLNQLREELAQTQRTLANMKQADASHVWDKYADGQRPN